MDVLTIALARKMAGASSHECNGATKQFESKEDAIKWAKENNMAGTIVTVKTENGYEAYVIEDDYTLTSIQGGTIDAGDSEIIDGGSPGDSDYTIIDGGSLSGF